MAAFLKRVGTLGCAVALIGGLGCSDDDPRAPAAPEAEAGRPLRPGPGGGGGGDGGNLDGGGGFDGSPTDASSVPGCVAVGDGLAEPNRARVIREGADVAFTVRGARATWGTNCARPTLFVALLAEDSCTLGVGQELLFLFDRDSIGASVAPGGFSLLEEPFDEQVQVRYNETSPAEIWGSCIGASGDFLFDELGDQRDDRMAGTFNLVLTDCTDPRDASPTTVAGAFDVTVPFNFDEACP